MKVLPFSLRLEFVVYDMGHRQIAGGEIKPTQHFSVESRSVGASTTLEIVTVIPVQVKCDATGAAVKCNATPSIVDLVCGSIPKDRGKQSQIFYTSRQNVLVTDGEVDR